jgi:F0F1-type ATP synthase assembly protein I
MLAIILLGTFAGTRIDHWVKTRVPVFTVILSMLSVVLAIYQVTREFMKRK